MKNSGVRKALLHEQLLRLPIHQHPINNRNPPLQPLTDALSPTIADVWEWVH
ncbi:hypothetical protein [Nostoc sp. UCD121]|uniref:hypothetical protein n=1 Tax=Nostoc sp. UCD121 TaxID=2681305 RepID=UPI0016286AED|nr:hypothetical protein [Nostoc sp. UCD121]